MQTKSESSMARGGRLVWLRVISGGRSLRCEQVEVYPDRIPLSGMNSGRRLLQLLEKAAFFCKRGVSLCHTPIHESASTAKNALTSIAKRTMAALAKKNEEFARVHANDSKYMLASYLIRCVGKHLRCSPAPCEIIGGKFIADKWKLGECIGVWLISNIYESQAQPYCPVSARKADSDCTAFGAAGRDQATEKAD